MKKRIILFISIVFVSLTIVISAYFNPKVVYSISKPVDTNTPNYHERIMLGYQTRLHLPLNNSTKVLLEDFKKQFEKIENEINSSKESNKHIEVSVEYEGKSTIIKYSGYILENGKKIPYDRTFSIDRRINSEI